MTGVPCHTHCIRRCHAAPYQAVLVRGRVRTCGLFCQVRWRNALWCLILIMRSGAASLACQTLESQSSSPTSRRWLGQDVADHCTVIGLKVKELFPRSLAWQCSCLASAPPWSSLSAPHQPLMGTHCLTNAGVLSVTVHLMWKKFSRCTQENWQQKNLKYWILLAIYQAIITLWTVLFFMFSLKSPDARLTWVCGAHANQVTLRPGHRIDEPDSDPLQHGIPLSRGGRGGVIAHFVEVLPAKIYFHLWTWMILHQVFTIIGLIIFALLANVGMLNILIAQAHSPIIHLTPRVFVPKDGWTFAHTSLGYCYELILYYLDICQQEYSFIWPENIFFSRYMPCILGPTLQVWV